MKDFIWFVGFKIFWFFAHPQIKPFIILRRLVQGIKRKYRRPEPDRKLTSHNIPKKIWIYWAEGWENAPAIVKLCRDSWIQRNSEWEVVLLDESNLSRHIELDSIVDKKTMSQVWKADIIRLHLLEQYGGVWADATTFCATPLDGWLGSVSVSGFFAFDKQKTTLASWFLVAEKDSLILRKWKKYAARYWKFTGKGRRYWIFFSFEYMTLMNSDIRKIWKNTAYINSGPAYVVQNLLKEGDLDIDECLSKITEEISPVHKLNWKIDIPDTFIDSLRGQLAEGKTIFK